MQRARPYLRASACPRRLAAALLLAVLAGLAHLAAAGPARAQGWFQHPFGELRAYHGDWLAVCADRGMGACRVVRLNPATEDGTAYGARLALAAGKELAAGKDEADWTVEVVGSAMQSASITKLAFVFDGTRIDLPRDAWRAGDTAATNVANSVVVTDPTVARDLVGRMRGGNRVEVVYAQDGGEQSDTFPLRGVTAATDAIGSRMSGRR